MNKYLCRICAGALGYSDSDINGKHFSHTSFCEECTVDTVEVAMFDGFDEMGINDNTVKVKLKEGIGVKVGDAVDVGMVDNVIGGGGGNIVNLTENDELISKLFKQIEGDAERLHTVNGVIKVLKENAEAMNKMVEMLNKSTAKKKGGCSGKCGG